MSTLTIPTIPSCMGEITLQFLNLVFSGNGKKVVEFSWNGEANNGLGAMSSLQRLTLKFQKEKDGDNEEETLTVILKFLPENRQMRDYMVSAGFAQRELKMFTELFRDWDEFYEERGANEKMMFRRPKCYFGGSEGEGSNYKQLLILEDLFASDFHMWGHSDHQKLSWSPTEAQPCVRLIAQFHAVSIAYKKTHGFSSYKTSRPFLNHRLDDPTQEAACENWLETGFAVVDRIVEKCQKSKASKDKIEIPEGFSKHLKFIRDNGFYNLRFLEPTEEDVEVVCHHDLHVNNFMFRGEQAVVYDFQASMNSHPMKDLSFFLIQSCEIPLFTTRLPEVVQFYHDVLHETLDALGVVMVIDYGVERMLEEWQKKAYLSVMHIVAGAVYWYGGGGDEGDEKLENKQRTFLKTLVALYRNGVLGECRLKP